MSEPPIRFCPLCGSAIERQYLFGQQRPVCPACGWVHYADPKVAVAALIEQDGKILLTRRINKPFQGYWTLPAGFINAHEDPQGALQREVQEETGLEVEIIGLEDVLGGREHPRGADILIAYRARITGGSLRPGDDASEVGFFALDNLPPLAFQSTKSLLGCME